MNPTSNLALINPADVSDIGQPRQKTADDFKAELAVIEEALRECVALVGERSRRSYRVQQATTSMALGTGSKEALQEAQRRLDESVDAILRKNHLEQSVTSIKDAISYMEGIERRNFCESIKADFDRDFALLKSQCESVMVVYKRMQTHAVKYQGLTSRNIFPEYLRQMHLPVLHGENDWAGTSQPTGRR